MAEESVRISKPRRWDVPFSKDMTEADVDLLMKHPPFNRIDESKFPASVPLRGILLNDAQLRRFDDGDIVVREGDYGNSAFVIVTGLVFCGWFLLFFSPGPDARTSGTAEEKLFSICCATLGTTTLPGSAQLWARQGNRDRNRGGKGPRERKEDK